jgi:hypothetical protein
MENASEGYLEPNRNFAQATRDIEAIEADRCPPMGGRSQASAPTVQRLTPRGQRAFRVGRHTAVSLLSQHGTGIDAAKTTANSQIWKPVLA